MESLKQYGTVILGGGGHTTEMISILKAATFSFVHLDVIVSYGDNKSVNLLKNQIDIPMVNVHVIPRPSNVGTRYSLVQMAVSLFKSIRAVNKTKGAFLLCNGPGVCVPFCLIHKILRPLTPIWYVESVTRVTTLSVTGKILQWFVNVFIVQSISLERTKYPRRIYHRVHTFSPY